MTFVPPATTMSNLVGPTIVRLQRELSAANERGCLADRRLSSLNASGLMSQSVEEALGLWGTRRDSPSAPCNYRKLASMYRVSAIRMIPSRSTSMSSKRATSHCRRGLLPNNDIVVVDVRSFERRYESLGRPAIVGVVVVRRDGDAEKG